MTLQYFIDNLWRWKCGLPDINLEFLPDLEVLRFTEWDEAFEQLMRNRLVMGAIRYGRMRAMGKPQYDRIKSIIKRLDVYNENGNKEILVDVANLCLLEFVECNHPNQHFHAIDENEHLEIIDKK
jgi:hypothetical protein